MVDSSEIMQAVEAGHRLPPVDWLTSKVQYESVHTISEAEIVVLL